ncbi:hypothetical protein Daus18300_000907 [Diaporthe australafricana]|uniref:Uncharacterized protein n=1 Tax=Diaporthe australafricana TaxID=127596 RepID=A0ABR3Y276_9PEZI
MATLQLKTPPKNNHHRFVPDRQDARPQFEMSTETTRTVLQSTAASTTLGEPHGADSNNQIVELPAGTIVAIIFSGLILTFILTGVYVYASARHKSRRDQRSTLGRRGHLDDDIEMQTPGHNRESMLDQESERQRQRQSQYQHHDRYRHQHRHPYHFDGAGMGYDDEDGMEARIEVGTARVAHFKLIPAGTVSITNIGRTKDPVSLKSSQSVRDVVSLPDLAWAESLTTGGGRRPGVAPFAAAAAPPSPPPPRAAASRATSISSKTISTSSKKTTSTSSKEREPSKKLQERTESRRAVKRKAIKEWCARGSGGSLGPYSGAY